MIWTLAIVAVVVVFIFSQIDDWKRDFTTNSAATDPRSDDLQPARLPLSPEAAADQLLATVATMPRWSVAEPSDHTAGEDGIVRLHLIRTTPLMRFKDDIHVELIPDTDGAATTVMIRSQSRVGKGDLGQNPRNIRELLRALETAA